MQISWTYFLHNTQTCMSNTSTLNHIKQNQLYLDSCGEGFVPFFHSKEQATLFLSLVDICFTLKRLVFNTAARLFSDTLLAFVRNFHGVNRML
jgi:hypothetical protein